MKKSGWIVLCFFVFSICTFSESKLEKLKEEAKKYSGPVPQLANFFPIGIWGTPDQRYGDRYADTFEDLKKHYMNSVYPVGIWIKGEPKERWLSHIHPFIEKGDKLGIYIMPYCHGLLPRKEKDKWDYKEAVKLAKERVLPLKDEKSVIGWYLCDEAPFNKAIVERFLKLKKFFRENTPNQIPVILLSIANSGGVERLINWLPYFDIVLSDVYSYSYHVDMLNRIVDSLTDLPHWITLQAFSYYRGHTLPDIRWIRLNIYISIARGAKGITLFTYSYPPNFTGFGAVGLVDAYGNPSPEGVWDKLGETMRILEPVAQVLVASKVKFAPIECFCRDVVEIQGRKDGVEPAIEIGTLRDEGQDIDFIVCYNNDTKNPHTATIQIYNYYLKDRKIYNLFSLKEVRFAKGGLWSTFGIEELEEGDGRIYAICREKTYKELKERILKRRYENERVIAGIDLEWSKSSGLEVKKAKKILKEAEEEAKKKNYGKAETLVIKAKELLKEALKKDKDIYEAYKNMREAQKILGKCDRLLTLNVNPLWSIVNKGWKKANIELDPLDPKVKPWIDLFMKMSEAYRRLRKMERRGHLREFKGETEFLLRTCRALESGIRDIIIGNYIPPTYSQKKLSALHDKCDKYASEKFFEYIYAPVYYPYDPRTVGIKGTTLEEMYKWFPKYQRTFFGTEEEGKKRGLKRGK